MWKLILMIVFCLMSLSSYPQFFSEKQHRLLVNLRNAPFSSLALLDYRDSHNVIIEAKHIDQYKWEFLIPDSIAVNSEFMMLFVPKKDTTVNAYRQVRFNHNLENKKTTIVNIGIQDSINYIEAEYKGKELFHNENIAYFSGNPDSVMIGDFICDDFDLSIKNDSSDITVRSIDPYYAWFERGNNRLSYSEHMQSYIKLAEMYPDSRYLMTYLALNLSRFKTRQDVRTIFEKFSGKQKNSKWASRIDHFLSDNFQNIPLLINIDSKHLEPIVQDSSKYNLIIFSASWCKPCIEEIPLLKELYKSLKSRLNFTYVSMDYEKDIQAFKKILIANDIPWRTLYAYKDRERMKDLFSIKDIPLSLLVYPGGHIEVMDVRNEENQKKLNALK